MLDVVELDPAIVRVAKEQFGFLQSDSGRKQQQQATTVHVQDGLEFIRSKAAAVTSSDGENNKKQKKKTYDVIFFDIDSKDVTVGMSCPPKPFVHPDFLAITKRCLNDKGM